MLRRLDGARRRFRKVAARSRRLVMLRNSGEAIEPSLERTGRKRCKSPCIFRFDTKTNPFVAALSLYEDVAAIRRHMADLQVREFTDPQTFDDQ